MLTRTAKAPARTRNRRYHQNQNHISHNIIEAEDSFILELMVPGFSKDDFSIEWSDGSLEVSFELPENEGKPINYIHRSYTPQSFTKSYQVKDRLVESEQITAEYRDGVMRVLLPKSNAALNLNRTITVD